jgi:tRNA-2-methylthio-N6-dimethylallyladenosine synthase
VERGVREITLLGQTVNAWGRHARRRAASAARREAQPSGGAAGPAETGFADLLRRLAVLPGLARLRYTSPHPLFFDAALARAHAELEALCPHVHLPLQSGSDTVLSRMRRRYTADAFRRVVEALRAARPDLALTTDLIVGFPGESDADFEATLALVREVGFVDAYSFKYSPRPDTAAAALADRIPPGVAQDRLEALQARVRVQTLAYHRSRVGGRTSVLVEGASRRGGQRTGRDPWHRVVNLVGSDPEPGALVPVRIVEATPHSLLGELALKETAPLADEPWMRGAFAGRAPRRTGTFAA